MSSFPSVNFGFLSAVHSTLPKIKKTLSFMTDVSESLSPRGASNLLEFKNRIHGGSQKMSIQNHSYHNDFHTKFHNIFASIFAQCSRHFLHRCSRHPPFFNWQGESAWGAAAPHSLPLPKFCRISAQC